MKSLQLACLVLILFTGNVLGQTAYNPFTQNIHFEPEPLPGTPGFACGTAPKVAFTMGLTTIDDATQFATEPLTVTVCITGFTFAGPASSIVTGTYASNFSWAISSTNPNCLIGTQIQTLPGTGTNPIGPNPLSSGSIKVDLQVPATSPIGTLLKVDVSLQVPPYMSTFNSTPDDIEVVQTQTYCPLVIQGTVFNDADTINNVNNVNGSPIYNPDATPLYAILVNSSNVVVASVPVASNGTYVFENVTGATVYNVVLSTVPGVVGSNSPGPDLPPLWVNTGEDCCDQTGNDGNPNGILTVSVTNFSLYNADFGIRKPGATGTLPTQLKDFFVSAYQCNALLSWTTAQELNTSHVNIYRKDGSQGMFRKIATVQSAGNSHTEKLYSYLDQTVIQSVAYEYQLQFVDVDGRFTRSDIKTLQLDCNQQNSTVNVFPNPAVNELNVLYVSDASETNLTLDIVDMAGRKLLTKHQTVKDGGSVLTLDIQVLAKGTYLLNYTDEEGNTHGSIQFVKH